MLPVTQYSFPTSLPWSEKLVSKLNESSYRHAYMMEGVKTWIARQVRTLREQRHWSQDDLGRETEKPQSAISRVEDPDYGKLTLQTLFDLARAYDLPLLVQFVEWSDWLARMNDASTEALRKESFSATALSSLWTGQIYYNEPMQQLVIDPFEGEQNKHLGFNYQTGNIGLLSNLTHVAATTWVRTVHGSHGQPHPVLEDTNKSRYYNWDFDEQFMIPPNKVLELSEEENG
jgi:transcriptional regulator with XRE-family HTH domain